MATVDKHTADRVVSGEFSEDNCVKIVKYTNRWGGESYGLIFAGMSLDSYKPTSYVINPTTYWEKT